MSEVAVTFDFGQTLTELDCEFLAMRLAEKDVSADAARLREALPHAWREYDRHCGGPSGSHPWRLLMRCLLQEAGIELSQIEPAVQWLWTEQPKVNLWRKPIPGMIELVRKVKSAGTRVAVISNSEGKLAELAELLGWQDDFEIIADSGRLGFSKPGPEIFEWTSKAIEVPLANIIHIGDSWAADVEGILAVGGRAIWFAGASATPSKPQTAVIGPKLQFTHSAAELEEALATWQIPL